MNSSSTAALQYGLKLAKTEVKGLQASVNDTEDVLNVVKTRKMELERAVMSKQEDVEKLESFLQNLTTEVQELHTTCDTVVATDCCQVMEY